MNPAVLSFHLASEAGQMLCWCWWLLLLLFSFLLYHSQAHPNPGEILRAGQLFSCMYIHNMTYEHKNDGVRAPCYARRVQEFGLVT